MAAQTADWVSYFQYLTSAAVALLAISFLVFQVRADIWLNNPVKSPVAVRTLIEIAAPLFFGLIFLSPGHPWEWAGYITGAFIYAALVFHFAMFLLHRRRSDEFDKLEVWGNIILLATSSALMWWPVLEVKAYVALWLIFSGSAHAWIYLQYSNKERKFDSETRASNPSPNLDT